MATYAPIIQNLKETAMVENTNLKEELKQIDDEIVEMKKAKRLADLITELHENEAFKEVILQGYLIDEADRIYRNLVTPMNMKRDTIENLKDKLTATKDLKEYFGTKLLEAMDIDDKILENEQLRKDVTAGLVTLEE